MTIRVLFKCGHEGHVDPSKAPRCACGETGIARSYAPAPRFTGHCTGPMATPNFALPPSAARFIEPDVPALTLVPPVEETKHG